MRNAADAPLNRDYRYMCVTIHLPQVSSFSPFLLRNRSQPIYSSLYHPRLERIHSLNTDDGEISTPFTVSKPPITRDGQWHIDTVHTACVWHRQGSMLERPIDNIKLQFPPFSSNLLIYKYTLRQSKGVVSPALVFIWSLLHKVTPLTVPVSLLNINNVERRVQVSQAYWSS